VVTATPVMTAALSAELIVVDRPRPKDRMTVTKTLSVIPEYGERPRLIIGGGRPDWEQLQPRHGSVLSALYAAGGEHNFRRFFALAKTSQGGAPAPSHLLEAPEALPGNGFYHPRAPRVFEHIDDYLGWHGTQRQSRPEGRVAFLIHRGVVSDMLTREVDTLIARSEAAGLLPIVFWFNTAGSEGLSDVLGNGKVDVLVNLTHLRDGKARRRDFLALDIPVIQTLRFRDGEASDWPDAKSGGAPRTTAVFLATPEGWGISDPTVLSATTGGVDDLLPAQTDALIGKLRSLVALRHTPAADKKLALMYWNYPAGEKNLGASNLNLPRSIVSIQTALTEAGYSVGEPVTEQQVIAAGQRMLGALYGTVSLDELLAEDMAALFPVDEYQQWLARLPSSRRAELKRGRHLQQHPAVRDGDRQRYSVIPVVRLGRWLVLSQTRRYGGSFAH